MPDVEGDLNLNIDPALAALDEVSNKFDDIVASFQDGFTAALSGSIDGLSGSLADAISQGFSEAQATLNVEAIDTGSLQDAVDQAIATIGPQELDVGINVSGDDELTQAEQEANSLSDGLDSANQSSQNLAGGFGGAANAANILSSGFQVAEARGGALLGSFGQFGGPLGKIVGGTAAAALGFKSLFEAGERSVAGQERLKIVFGDTADAITKIDVGGLTGEMSDLAIKAGSSGGAMKQAAATIGELGINSGKTQGEVALTVQQVSALALRAAVLNPRLGEAGQIMDRLGLALARGGRALARYNIDISSAEITTRALAESGKATAKELTIFEREAAGAAIAAEKLGTSIGTDFERGAKQSTIQLRSFSAEIKSAFAGAGKDLVEPTIEALKSLTPVIKGVITVLGDIGKIGVPVFGASLKAVGDIARPLFEILEKIPAPILGIGAAAFVLRGHLSGLEGAFKQVFFANREFGNAVGPTDGLLRSYGGTIDSTGTKMSRFGSFTQFAHEQTSTFSGRALVALGSLALLDGALSLAGTSTEELGLHFTQLGGALGFALGGPWGAALGALAGGLVDLLGGTKELDVQVQAISDDFGVAGHQATVLGQSLFGGVSDANSLTEAIKHIDTNLTSFIETTSRFKANNLIGALKDIGLSTQQVGVLARSGSDGLVQFFDTAVKKGAVTNDLNKALREGIDISKTSEAQVRTLTRAIDGDTAARKLNAATNNREVNNETTKSLIALGVGAKVTGEEFAHLTSSQQELVLKTLQQSGGNDKLISSFVSLQHSITGAVKAEVENFVTANNLSGTIVQNAENYAKAAGQGKNYLLILNLLADAARGTGIAFAGLPGNLAVTQRALGELGQGLADVVKKLPSLGDAFGDALTKVMDIEDAAGKKLGEGAIAQFPEKITESLNTTSTQIATFFKNISTIIESGSPSLAAALVQLGPTNLGAQAAATLAANNPQIRDGWEKALQGLSQAEIVAEGIIAEQRARIKFLASTIGNAFIEGFAEHKFGKQLGQLTSDQMAEVATAVQGAKGPIGESATSVVEAARERFVAMHLNEPWEQAVKEFNDTFVTDGVSLVGKSGEIISDVALGVFSALPPKTSAAGAKAGTAFATGLGSTTGATSGSGSRHRDAAVESMESAFLTHEKGTAAGASYAAGLASQRAASAAAAAADAAAASAAFILDLSALGANAGASFAAGISSQTQHVSTAADELAQAVELGLISSMEIGSPSKVTMRYGQWVGQGFADGIVRMLPVVTDSATGLAEAVNDALSGTILDPSQSTGTELGAGIAVNLAAAGKTVADNLAKSQGLAGSGSQTQLNTMRKQLADFNDETQKILADVASSNAFTLAHPTGTADFSLSPDFIKAMRAQQAQQMQIQIDQIKVEVSGNADPRAITDAVTDGITEAMEPSGLALRRLVTSARLG